MAKANEKKVTLSAKDVKVRVDRIDKYFVNLLVYVDARCVTNLLDAKFGEFGWKRTFNHKQTDANGCTVTDLSICTVSVWDEKKQMWIEREDVGTESAFSSLKGQVSDGLKRAGVLFLPQLRALYDVPDIRVKKDLVGISAGKNGKETTYDTFSVADICFREDGEISALAIRNDNTGKLVYIWDGRTEEEKKSSKKTKKKEVSMPTEAAPEIKAEETKETEETEETSSGSVAENTPESIFAVVNGEKIPVTKLTKQQARWLYSQPTASEIVKNAIRLAYKNNEDYVAFFAKQGLTL